MRQTDQPVLQDDSGSFRVKEKTGDRARDSNRLGKEQLIRQFQGESAHGLHTQVESSH